MILYRPVGLQELEMVYDGGMKAFPARLPHQPIFYPVLQLEYARQVAAGWNAKNGQLAGYVTQFKVEDDYIDRFEEHTVGESQHEEYWIPAEEVEEFNRHITGHIKVLEAHFGDAFEGFIPENFGLGGKNAVEQFTELANTYIYERMDFYLEIKRNHKAIFLNYPFWLKYDFKNPGLKEKVLKAIKDAWLTSFPKIPLPNPVQEDVTPGKQPDSPSSTYPAEQDSTPAQKTNSIPPVAPIREQASPVRQTNLHASVKPDQNDIPQREQPDSNYLADPIRVDTKPIKQTESHFQQGVKLGLSGDYQGAVAELLKAVEENPHHVIAQVSLGVALHRLGEEDRALSSYETAIKKDPKYAEAHYFRANILYHRGDIREAMEAYTSAIGLKPDLIRAHEEPPPQNRLTDYTRTPAEIYRIARHAHRIIDLNKALENNPRQANLLKERAAQYDRLLNYEQAIKDYSSSLALKSDDATVLHARGVAYDRLGQPDRALEDFQRALAINPQLSNVYISRGVTFGQMGNFRQSIASLTEGIRLAPRNADAYFNRGMSYVQLGDLESAIQDFSKVIQLAPGDEAAYYWRGISYEEARRRQEAIDDYRQFLGLSQDKNARAEIEQRLRQWGEGKRSVVAGEQQKSDKLPVERPDRKIDLADLIAAFGERALHSTWFGSGVDCRGETAKELYALTDQNQPIEGEDFLRIAAGIHQTIKGDFQAFDPGERSPWIFLRAWDGNGFYIETDDPQIEKALKKRFPAVEEVEGANPPYVSLFLPL